MKGFRRAFATLIVSSLVSVALSEESGSDEYSAIIPCKESSSEKSGDNLTYVWAYGNSATPLSNNKDLKDRTSVTGNGALLINRFTKKDHGKYICIVKSGNTVVQEHPVNVDNKYRLSRENCNPASCITANKCFASAGGLTCPTKGEVCCSMIRDEDRYLCRQFLGECMKRCGRPVQVKGAQDCEKGTQCCVLVN